MRIAIIGYGKMGREIESVALERGHSISHRISSRNQQELHQLQHCDVAVEFTAPDAALPNFKTILNQNIPLVTGTTGWHNDIEKVKEMVGSEGRFFYASNFSIGVNIAFAANAYLARLLAELPQYKSRIHEIHHTEKKDAPSGTAISFAKAIVAENPRYTGWSAGEEEGEKLPVTSERTGNVPGTHEIWHESSEDTLLLKHQAKGRRGFAVGAVLAAEFLVVQKPGLYTMNDLLKF